MKAIIVIPTYNESENIEKLIKKIFSIAPEINILIVDDNSPDGTANIVEQLMKSDSRLHLIKRTGKLGLGTAYIEGFKYALSKDFEVIFEMDADFSHNPEDIPRFLEAIEDADLVIGSRYLTGVNVINWPLKRLILSYFANFYTRVITGMPVKDATGGFKCFRASALRQIDLDKVKTNGYGFQIEMNFRFWAKGLRIKEIPIVFVDRMNGVSKMNKKIILEAIFLVWKLKLCKIFKCL
ncbi:MAG: Dolichol-phosphate mannosyltransferase [Candidatus Kapaibacterium sp.]|jgi:dolichol-phosphate mannosyltransferase|nr:MAG: Dolichol-phosphate mannosyltransferase [Candidatus Kapabacteria bacterium]ROL57901.1 MAG: polyprenol monophosphomannose synthase [Bacteroidetes/Chlorobi group bacterium Naka2016]